MKKYLPLLALALSFEAQSCTFSYDTANTTITKVIKKSGGFDLKKFDTICPALNKANASLVLSGHATVLAGASIGWVSVRLKDKNSHVMNAATSSSTYANTSEASMDLAESLLYNAINDAIDSYDLEDAIEGLNKARRETFAQREAKSRTK